MGVPTKSFVISFGEARVSPHSISFSHTLFDGLRFSLGMTNNQSVETHRVKSQSSILLKKHILRMLCWMPYGIFPIIGSIDESTEV